MEPHDRLAPFLTRYFQEHLVTERNVSPNTVLSYRDALKLFLIFMKEQTNRSCTKLRMQDVTADRVRQFLHSLEQDRGNSIRSRNHRLAALRCFFEYVAKNEPRHADLCGQIVAVPIKRHTRAMAEYLETDEIRAIFDQIDRNRGDGPRDYALLLFLYNAGARVAEAAQLRLSWLELTKPYCVSILGKGRKWRTCPLWTATGEAFQILLAGRSIQSREEHVFLNRFGAPLSRHGIFDIVKKYARKACARMPRLSQRRISPHTLRHTTAMHMLQAGIDLNSIRSWLGHASLQTTHQYAQINLRMKTEAMEKCEASFVQAAIPSTVPSWRANPDILDWLQAL